jgi:hypothetical protein
MNPMEIFPPSPLDAVKAVAEAQTATELDQAALQCRLAYAAATGGAAGEPQLSSEDRAYLRGWAKTDRL